MISRPQRRALPFLVLAAVTIVAAAVPVFGQDGEFTAEVTFETGEGTNAMEVNAGAEHLRLNMSAEQGGASLVWGPTSMLMIMHEQRMYMEFTQEMMERMSGMMGAMGGAPPQEADSKDFDPSDYSFETTGATDEINGMTVFEVAMSGPEGKRSQVWLSEDAEVGLFEVFSRMASSLKSMSMPGMSRMNPAAGMEEYLDMARAQGMPEGKVIRIVDADSSTEITLGAVTWGAHDPSTWTAPEGYDKQSMPTMQR